MKRETSDELDDILMDDEPTTDEPEGEHQDEAIETGDNIEGTEPPSDASQQDDLQADEGPHVPRKALEDERRKRQELDRKLKEYEARLTQQQQPQQYYPQQPQQYQPPVDPQYQQFQEPPDPILDPEGAFHYQQQTIQHTFSQIVNELRQREYENGIEMSQYLFADKYPDYDEVVVMAAETAKSDPGLLHKIQTARFPGLVAYQEGKKLQALQSIGNDPDAYKSKLEQEIEAKLMEKYGITPESSPGEQAPRQSAKSPVPKSLATTPSSRPRRENGQFAEVSLDDIFDD